MDELLLHPRTKKRLNEMLSRPPHALLIYGSAGSGKLWMAKFISAQLLDADPLGLLSHPYFILVSKPVNKQDIPIDAIRDVIRQLNLKVAVSGSQKINRVIVIDEAEKMSNEAQNALLKAIEEPPARTVFILTSTSEDSVLPTIASRAERLAIIPVSLQDALTAYASQFLDKDIESAWALSGGAAALLESILKDGKEHPLKSAVEVAKRLLATDIYNRILLLDSLSDDKARFTEVLDALSRTLAVLHNSAIKAGRDIQAGKILKARRLIDSAQKSISHNTSARLLALNLAQQLSL
jgi:DNA polymerase III subunit delta'